MLINSSITLGLVVIALLLASRTDAVNTLHTKDDKFSRTLPDSYRQSYANLLATPGHLIRHVNYFHEGVYSDTLHKLTRLFFRESEHGYTDLAIANVFASDSNDTPWLLTMTNSLQGLAEQDTSSHKCVNDTGHLITSIVERQTWALKFLDATGKIGPGLSELRINFVGDYDLCLSLVAPDTNETEGFRGSYTTLKAALGPVTTPLATLMIQWGVCMPDSCSEQDITLLLVEALRDAGLNGTLKVLPAEHHSEEREATPATVAAIIIVCVIGILMFAGTLYDIIFLQWPRWQIEWAHDEKNINKGPGNSSNGGFKGGPGRQDDDEALLIHDELTLPPPVPSGRFAKALVAFSVYTNGSKVLNTTQASDSITCIHGIRFFSMTWVILGHTLAQALSVVENTVTEVPILLNRWAFDAISNAFVSVDSFFALSGLLVSYLTVTEMKKRGWKLNWGLFYFHRFWRLTPPYMLVIVLILGLQQYCGNGPLWSQIQPQDKDACTNYWWTNLLYVNNLVYARQSCLAQSWYLANDMQFYVISPLLIIPFYFNPLFGFVSCFVFLLTSMIVTGVLSTQHHWATSILTSAMSGNYDSYFFDYYVTPWCRIGPYIVGIVTGYILASKKNKIKLTWPIALTGWLIAIATALAALYGLRGDIGGKHPSSLGVAALYNSVARSAWAAALCWLIVACVAGWGGFVNTFLSWSPFVVLGRLTYMAYLIHMCLMNIYFQNQDTLYYLTGFNIAVTFMAVIVATYGMSFIFMLGLESPMIGLEKVFLPKRRKD